MYCEPIRTETSVEVDEEEHASTSVVSPAFVVASAPVFDKDGPSLALVPPLADDTSGSSSAAGADTSDFAAPVVPAFAVAQGSTVAAPGKFDWLYGAGWRVSIAAIAISSILSYFCLHSLTGYYYWQITGVQHDFYMHTAHNASGIGVLTALLCFVAYLKSFVGIKSGRFTWIARTLLALGLVSVGGLAFGATGGLFTMGICGLFLLMHGLGTQVHQALPTTFRFKRALLLNGLVTSPAALFVIYSIMTRPERPADYSPTYSEFSGSEFGTMIFAMVILMGVATYVVSRSARTSEVKPLVLLGVLQQSPLLLGFLMQVLSMGSLTDSAPFVVSGLLTLLTTVAVIAVSASAAAVVNGRRHRRKMAITGGYVF